MDSFYCVDAFADGALRIETLAKWCFRRVGPPIQYRGLVWLSRQRPNELENPGVGTKDLVILKNRY